MAYTTPRDSNAYRPKPSRRLAALRELLWMGPPLLVHPLVNRLDLSMVVRKLQAAGIETGAAKDSGDYFGPPYVIAVVTLRGRLSSATNAAKQLLQPIWGDATFGADMAFLLVRPVTFQTFGLGSHIEDISPALAVLGRAVKRLPPGNYAWDAPTGVWVSGTHGFGPAAGPSR